MTKIGKIPTMEYVDKIWGMLDKLPLEKGGRNIFILKNNVSSGNKEMFIDAVKLYIDSGRSKARGCCVEFSDDYEKIRKFKL